MPTAYAEVGHVNAYAIARDDGLLLVDCGGAGHPSCEQTLGVALGQAGFAVEDVRQLAATHAHSDHIGLAAWVIERSGCEFLMHAASDHFYEATRQPASIGDARERRARAEGVPDRLLPHYRDTREETQGVIAAVAPDRYLVDGQRLPSRLGDWEVLETPGHSPSHVALIQRDRGLAITGDTLCTIFVPWFDYGYSPDPVAEFIASLDRLEALGRLEIAFPGHGRPLEDLPASIAAHRDGVAARLTETVAAIEAGPAGAYTLTRRIFSDPVSEPKTVWQMAEVICYLRHLRLTGAIVRETEADRFTYRLAAPDSSSSNQTLG
jgi:glyoxylase-like metal-dependent hydrolase (beta-lactamase superfamily II)